MENVRAGDNILISGSAGEDWIVARGYAKDFASASITKDSVVENWPLPQPKICHSCGQSISKVHKILIEGHVSIDLETFKPEDLQELNGKYDLIFQIEARNGGFGPILVGGKRYKTQE